MNDLIAQYAVYAALILAACMLVIIVKNEIALRRSIKRITTAVAIAEAELELDAAINKRVAAYVVEDN